MHAACSTEAPDSESLDAVSCDGARFDHNGTCRLPNGRFAKESCCAVDVDPIACDVVWVNYSVSELEEGFGSYYDIDSEGYSMSDEDAEDIDIETLREKNPNKLVPPLHGALLKNEQDIQLFERLAFLARRENG